MFFTPDEKDIYYTLIGFVFLGLTLLPFLKGVKFFSAPIFYIFLGGLLSFISVSLPFMNVQSDDLERRIFEHYTELIVIISLAGAGLAIDRRPGWKSWQHTWILLIIVMPLTIIATFLLGYYYLGLPIATACLLAAVLSPTDPVLARSVQVDGPNSGEENDVNVSLTAEAGLNDGLAFPFVYFAIMVAGLSSFSMEEVSSAVLAWTAYDFLYRVVIGTVFGVITGYALSKIVLSKHGDANKGGENAGLVLLASVFLTYGITELMDGYGFLGVFIAALMGKKNIYEQNKQDYAELPHLFSDQFEKILMALLLLWIGYYSLSGGLEGLQGREILFALLMIFIVRPVLGYISFLLTKGSKLDRFAISFLGIKGIGTLYYLAYAQNNQSFENLESLWRIVLITIILSIIIHGSSANLIMQKIHERTYKKSR